jgi:hypothetical protein
MATIFATDDDPALDELCREVVLHRRAGRVHVEFRRLEAPSASAHALATAFVQSLAMKPPEVWTDLDGNGAHEAATRVMHADLAYDMHVMTYERARALARRFLVSCGDGAVFVTNGSLAQSGSGRAWSPLTGANFDTGVVGVSARRLGLLWVEDED